MRLSAHGDYSAYFHGKFGDLLLQLAHAADQIRQLLDSNELPLGLLVRRCWNSENGSLVRYIAHHTGLRADRRLIAKLEMPRDAGLRCDHAVITQPRAARKAHLAHHKAVTANNDVVSDVHEIINLRPLANDSGTEPASIDGCVRANLDVVVNNDISDLENLAMTAFIEDVAVTIRANGHCAGVDGNAISADL